MEEEKWDLNWVLKEGHELTAEVQQAEHIIAFIGTTGSGKSSLVKFLAKDASLKIKEDLQKNCIFIDKEETISGANSASFKSKTLLPNVTKDEETGCMIVDCAGFNDTRSDELDFVAAFMNKEFLGSAKKIKIVIVENNSNLILGENRDGFLKNLMLVTELLKFCFTSFQTSICLVANKVDTRKSDENAISGINVFLEKFKDYLSEKCSTDANIDNDTYHIALKIVSYLQDGRVGILRRPSDLADDPWELNDLKQNFFNLRRLIFEELQFAGVGSDEHHKFNITVAPNTLIWMNSSLISQTYIELQTSLNPIIRGIRERMDAILQSVEGRPRTKIRDVITVGKRIISELSEIKNEKDVILLSKNNITREEFEEFEFCLKKIKFIHGVLGKDEKELLNIVAGLNGHRNALIEDTENVVACYEILSQVDMKTRQYEVFLKTGVLLEEFEGIDVNIDSEDFKLKLLTILKAIDEEIAKRALSLKKIRSALVHDFLICLENICDNKVSITVKNNTCFIFGRVIVLSQQWEQMQQKYPQSHNQIVIAATQLLFIDRDLTLESAHLVLVAPLIDIVNDKRIIKLLGENGIQHEEKKAISTVKGAPGARGLDGNMGYSSGSFNIIALDMNNPNLLEIVSRGGDGGDGQDGGDALNISCDRPEFFNCTFNATKDEVINGFESIMKTSYHIAEISDADITEGKLSVLLESHPDLAEKPSNGGNGGNAGQSAVAGYVNVKVKNESVNVVDNRLNGAEGSVGNGGSGGQAKGMFQKYHCSVLKFTPPAVEQSRPIKLFKRFCMGAATAAATVGAFVFAPAAVAAVSAVEVGAIAATGAGLVAGAGTSSVPSVISWISSSLTKAKAWEVKAVNTLESGTCKCFIFKAEDGNDGRPATVDPNPRYKVASEGLLLPREMKQAFASFSSIHGYGDGEDYTELVQFWQV